MSEPICDDCQHIEERHNHCKDDKGFFCCGSYGCYCRKFNPLEPKKVTLSGKPPEEGCENIGAPAPIDPTTGMHKDYWILSEEERLKGFVRPVRRKYIHEKCGVETVMGIAIAETYARDPKFYGATFCVHCKAHFPVGPEGEFVWSGMSGKFPEPQCKVGT